MITIFQTIAAFIRSFSIREKIAVSLLAVALIPLILSGSLTLWSFFTTSSNEAIKALSDKIRIVELLWQARGREIEGAALNMAEDNLVILNSELGLTQPLGDYLQGARDRASLDMAFITDVNGKIIAQSSGGNLSDSFAIPGSILQQSVSNRGAQFVFKNDDSPSADGQSHDFGITFVYPIRSYTKDLLGFAVAGIAFRGDKDSAATDFLRTLNRETQVPVLFLEQNNLLWASMPLVPATMILPGKVASPSEAGIHATLGNLPYLLRFFTLSGDDGSPTLRVGLALSEGEYLRTRDEAAILLLVIFVLAFGAAIVVAIILSRALSTPIIALSASAKQIVEGNFDTRIEVSGTDEIAVLALEFNIMTQDLRATMEKLNSEVIQHKEAENRVRQLNEELEERVEDRTQELSVANESLQDSLDLLQRTQTNLIESEKLAALGQLVAGVAHELNTPIGTSLTAATYLVKRADDFEKTVHENSLSKNKLVDFVQDIGRVAHMLDSNLNKAADQIRFFRQMSTDHTSDMPRAIHLFSYIDDLINTMRPSWRGVKITEELRIPEGLSLYILPQGLFQVFSQLVNNSIQHGFAGRDEGAIRIAARAQHDQIELAYQDDGLGIGNEQRPHIFEPFYTTARSKGNAGLGLSIVHNIVTRQLQGTIKIDQAYKGRGLRFLIYLPLRIGSKIDL